MKIFFIGCVAFSYTSLQTLLKLSKDIDMELVGVATKEHSSFNADFCNLSPLCLEYNIPFIYAKNINAAEILAFIHSCKPDIIYCFGWSELIKPPLLQAYPIIGYHPSHLPFNRGRHPVIWALFLGLKESASSFFVMDSGADSGEILSQEPFKITPEDNAQSLCEKIESLAQKQICSFTRAITQRVDSIKRGGGNTTFAQVLHSLCSPQDHSLANLWRKRGVRDGIVDFRMSAEGIYNLIRALSKPYVGAEVLYNDSYYKVWEAKIVEVNLPHIEPGKVLKVDSQGILAKAYDKGILLTHHEIAPLPKEGD